ncbi:MAG: CBS domain-containing protein [Cyanobacteria bacterium J06642_9]
MLADAGIHRAPVIENHDLLGIVSVTDILTKGSSVNPPQDDLASMDLNMV